MIVGLVSGAGVWLTGPDNSIHLGASGLVFGYAAYLLTRGFFNRAALEIIVGAAVAVLWGTALLGGARAAGRRVLGRATCSGAIGGVLAARVLRRERPREGKVAG